MAINLKRHPDFPSDHVPPRNVEVWLPPGYAESDARYPVLYMQDGQNLFDPELSFTGITWGVAEALTKGIATNRLNPAIIVGIWNTSNRFGEYMPQAPITLNENSQEQFELWRNTYAPANDEYLCGDEYLEFLVKDLKPFIDNSYRTQPGTQTTLIAGSSMGALISIYALCKYPQIFGSAACISTHWPVGNGIMEAYLDLKLPTAGQHKIYFDHGTIGLDAFYDPFQRKVDALMAAKGFEPGVDWLTHVALGADHNEQAWQDHIHIPLEFLLHV
jgi:predicted alpha/beta superfamily hydrolase